MHAYRIYVDGQPLLGTFIEEQRDELLHSHKGRKVNAAFAPIVKIGQNQIDLDNVAVISWVEMHVPSTDNPRIKRDATFHTLIDELIGS